MTDQQPIADAAEVASLIHTALYDTDGETVEGAFVDRWEPYALTAVDDLQKIFRRRGFTAADEELLRQGVCEPGAPTAAAVTLLRYLRPHTLPLLEKLLSGDSPEGQAVAFETMGALGKPGVALSALNDPNPRLRHSALRALIASPGSGRSIEEHLIHALDDPDPGIRLTTAQNIDFVKRPAGAKALIARFDCEESTDVRNAILEHVIETVRREGVHCNAEALRKYVGKRIQSFLIEQMGAHPDPDTRYEVMRALERLWCPEVARAFLKRLEVETEHLPRAGLVSYPAWSEIADEAFPVMVRLITDPNAAVRTGATFSMGQFGPRSIPYLMETLKDPEEHIRRAAAMTLGQCRAGSALPRLLEELWDRPRNGRYAREFESAVRDVSCYVPGPPPDAPDAALSAQIQSRIDRIEALHPGAWPQRICKEELNALPLFGTQIYMWCLRPDGTLLCWDHEGVRPDEEPETRPRYLFAIMVRGAIEYPELTPLIPKRPDNVTLCHYCNGRGWYQNKDAPKMSCMTCDTLGWMERH